MWRRNDVKFGNDAQENHDSDESISEDEEGLESEWRGKSISIDRRENNKCTIQILSHLEILRESCELHSPKEEFISSHLKKGGYHIEDEVEIPMFNDGEYPSHQCTPATATLPHSNDKMVCLPVVASNMHSDDEIISDDEKINPPALISASEMICLPVVALNMHSDDEIIYDDEKINPSALICARENLGGTWSKASCELEELARSNEKASCSPRHDIFVNGRKSSRGGGGRKKAKPKFSFSLHSIKKDLSLVVSDCNGSTSSNNIPVADEIGVASDNDMDNDIVKSELNFHDKETEPGNHTFELAHKHDTKVHSMAEFLNCFLERSNYRESPEVDIPKKRRVHKISKSTSPLGDIIIDEDDLPDALDSGLPFQSEDDEGSARCVRPVIPRTMADQFHEAFETASVIDDRLHAAFQRPLCGLHTKLQQVMQSEKESEMHSLKNASAETGFQDEGMPNFVRILSRSLEAKLVVCSCTSIGNGKNSYWENNLRAKMKGVAKTLTVIFNPRICSNVDLEIGNLICVRQPWKEVQVKDEVIYLCSYFAQVQPR